MLTPNKDRMLVGSTTTYIHTYLRAYVRTYIRTYVRTYVYTYYIYPYVHARTHTHTHTHTRMYVMVPSISKPGCVDNTRRTISRGCVPVGADNMCVVHVSV